MNLLRKMAGILGKKIGITQIFNEEGEVLPVTLIEGGPCAVLQIKTKDIDGYDAIQIGFEDVKESKLKRPVRGKFKKANIPAKRLIKEIRVTEPKIYSLGQNLDLTQFSPGDFVDIVGISKGRGFQGGIKRWHWKRGPETHGSMSHRAPGSIGASAFPSRVVKGHHLPGHMGNQRVTVQNLEVIKVDKENNLLLVKGSVPGHKNSYLIIRKSKKKKVKPVKIEVKPKVEQPKKQEPKEEKKTPSAAKPQKSAEGKG